MTSFCRGGFTLQRQGENTRSSIRVDVGTINVGHDGNDLHLFVMVLFLFERTRCQECCIDRWKVFALKRKQRKGAVKIQGLACMGVRFVCCFLLYSVRDTISVSTRRY